MSTNGLRAIGFDGGYNYIKAVATHKQIMFRTAISQYKPSMMELFGSSSLAFEEPSFVFGDDVIDYQRGASIRTDRDWITADMYPCFFQAAMAELGIMNGEHLNVVSGLPIRYYKHDSQTLKEQLLGQHTFKRIRGNRFTFSVDRATVFAQAIGVLAGICIEHGTIIDMDIATSHVAIIDIGGRTTNFLHAYRLKDVPDESDSIDAGCAMWDIAKELQTRLLDRVPGLTLSILEASRIVEKKEYKIDGELIDIQQDLQDAQEFVVQNIINKAEDLWRNMKKLDYIFVAGGGGTQLFKKLNTHISRANLVPRAIYANAKGYSELAEYQNAREK